MKQLLIIFVVFVGLSIHHTTAQTNIFGHQLSFDDVISNALTDETISFIVEHNKTSSEAYKLLKPSLLEYFPDGKLHFADEDSKKLIYLGSVAYPIEKAKGTLPNSGYVLHFTMTIDNKDYKSRIKIQEQSITMFHPTITNLSQNLTIAEFLCDNPIAVQNTKMHLTKALHWFMLKSAANVISQRKELYFQTISDLQTFIHDKLNKKESEDTDW
jgi:hypothetical protein